MHTAQTILVVDDEFSIRKVLRKILERAGYKVVEAQDGLEALQKVRQDRYDLITMDLAMGSIDGVDTISVLRGETDVPVVAISAHMTGAMRADLQNRGVYHIVSKPFSQKAVLAAIKGALGQA